MSHLNDFTDDRLISTLHAMTATMHDIESGKLKLDNAAIQRIGKNANEMTDELERRNLQSRFVNECPRGLRQRLIKRGIK